MHETGFEMGLFLLLLITGVFSQKIIRQHFYESSWMTYYFITIVNDILSIWLWILWFKITSHRGFYDEPENIWLIMNMNGMLCAVVLPRFLLCLFHYTGMLIKRKKGEYHHTLTNTGFIIYLAIFAIIATGTVIGRFNFKTENYTVNVKGLHHDLDGLRIVQISDLHLASFYHHKDKLTEIMETINGYHPDLLVNTGDFVSFGWREFGRFDTILKIAGAEYGNFAVMGNHDFGTYHPSFTEADERNNVLLLHKYITSSGYRLLDDESAIVNVGSAKIAMAGINTSGSVPNITYGNFKKAISGTDSADIKILLSHDPNQWEKDVRGKTDIDISFSGHTHGMQIGISTKNFKWSPAHYLYPRWNGLYREGSQYLEVNCGLGVLGMPFRIWMPPEIVIITVKATQ